MHESDPFFFLGGGGVWMCETYLNHQSMKVQYGDGRSNDVDLRLQTAMLHHKCSIPYSPCKSWNHYRSASECFPDPPYLSNPTPSHSHIFGPRKEATKGKTFSSVDKVKKAAHEWYCTQPKDIFFLIQESMPSVTAEGLAWNIMETMSKKWYLYDIFPLINHRRKKKTSRFSFGSASYNSFLNNANSLHVCHGPPACMNFCNAIQP